MKRRISALLALLCLLTAVLAPAAAAESLAAPAPDEAAADAGDEAALQAAAAERGLEAIRATGCDDLLVLPKEESRR